MVQPDYRPELTVYATSWCPDCRRARNFFDQHHIPYKWVDIDKDMEGRKYVESVNHGNRSVPTILFPDGSTLVEPSNKQLEEKLKIDAT
jgi:glutaredoxin-like protein